MILPIANTERYYVIIEVAGTDKLRQYLASLGIIKGKSLRIMSQGKTGTIILVNETRLALNYDIAKLITIA